MGNSPSRTAQVLLAALIYLLAGLFQTRPLLLHLSSHIPYSAAPHPGHQFVPLTQGDHLQLLYHFWTFGESLEKGRPFFPSHLEFSVGEKMPSFSTQFFPLSFGYWLLSFLGPTLAYNLLLLFSYVLSGLSGYMLCSLFFPSGPSLLGGLVFALSPFRYVQLVGGHPNGFVSFLAPMALALLIYAFRRPSTVSGWLSGMSFLFLCATDITAAYFTSFLYFPLLLLLIIRPVREGAGAKHQEAFLPAGGSWIDTPWPAIFCGAAVSIAYSAWKIRYVGQPFPSPWDLASVVFHGLMGLLAWYVLSALIGTFFPLSLRRRRRLATAALSPLLLLLLYPLSLLLPIPGWGRLLASSAALTSIVLVSLLLRRSGVKPVFAPGIYIRGRLKTALPVLFMSLLAMAVVFQEKRSRIATSSISAGRSYEEVKIYAPGPHSFLSRDYRDAEKVLYAGAIAMALSLLALLPRRKGQGLTGNDRTLVAFFAWGSLLAALLALGPRGEPISPLFPLLRKIVPLYDLSRAPSRIFLLAVLGLSLGAAGGAQRVMRKVGGRKAALLPLLLLAAAAFEYSPPTHPGLSGIQRENGIYRRIAEDIDDGRVMDVPIWPGDSSWSSLYLHYATLYRTPTINGYSPMVPGGYVEAVFRPLEDVNLGEVRQEQYHLLKGLNVRYLVFHEEAFPPQVSPYPYQLTVENLLSSPFLGFVDQREGLWLFRILERPLGRDAAYGALSVMGKVYEAEHHSLPPGSIVEDPAASGGRRVFYPSSFAGPVTGPFPDKGKYPTGEYRYKVFAGGERAAPPRLKVTLRHRESGALIAESREVPGSAGGSDQAVVEGTFRLEKPAPIAFELVADGGRPFSWDFLYLLMEGEKDPRWEYEAEDLVHMGRAEEHPPAEGSVVSLLPGRDPSDYVLLGPDRVLPPGRYGVSLDYSSPGAAGWFEAAVVGGESLGRSPLDGSAPGPSMESTAPLHFSLPAALPVRYRIFFSGKVGLLLDRITVGSEEPRVHSSP